MSRPWTAREVAFLKRNYPRCGRNWCALRLKRSPSSVTCKAKRLELEVGDVAGYLTISEVHALSHRDSDHLRVLARRDGVLRIVGKTAIVPKRWAAKYLAGADERQAFREASQAGYLSTVQAARLIGVNTDALARALDGCTGAVDLALGESVLHVRAAGGSRIALKLMDGTLPDYDRLIPSVTPEEVVLERAALVGTLERLKPFIGHSESRVDLVLLEDRVRLTAGNDYGTADEELPARRLEHGSRTNWAFNAKFLAQAVGAARSEEIVLRFGANNAPLLIRDETYTAIVVPLRD